MQTFKLIPHPADKLPEIRVTGEIGRVENLLSLHFIVHGDVENLHLPTPSSSTRKNGLWEATCFEFFLAIPDLPNYWEFNISPSSEWNIYHMDAYRQVNMREETRISQLSFVFQKREDGYSLDVSVDLSPIIQAGQRIQLGIAAIIQTKNGNGTYWALLHPGRKADFHLRESFILDI
jgi:hypothetical protein